MSAGEEEGEGGWTAVCGQRTETDEGEAANRVYVKLGRSAIPHTLPHHPLLQVNSGEGDAGLRVTLRHHVKLPEKGLTRVRGRLPC